MARLAIKALVVVLLVLILASLIYLPIHTDRQFDNLDTMRQHACSGPCR